MKQPNAPWLKSYGDVKFNLKYPDCSLSKRVYQTAAKHPNTVALTFQGKKITYKELVANVDLTAKSLSALGVKKGDRVTVCLPNMPQAIYSFYAINRIGAIASMIHPLSAVGEIEFFLNEVSSEYVVTVDLFIRKFFEVEKSRHTKKIIVTSFPDALDFPKNLLFPLSKTGKKVPKFRPLDNMILWKDFIKLGRSYDKDCFVEQKANDVAVVLFSGGTTGVTKGIQLSNLNFNALAYQTIEMNHGKIEGTRMLAAMPVFHGFGLGVCIHTMMVAGGTSMLLPQVNVKEYAKVLKNGQPNYIAGVPTLYEGITRSPNMDGVDLSCLMGVFSGGDSLSVELKKKIDKFLDDHGSHVHVREGYGTTECVTASCLTPYNQEREGSIGLPYPDTYYRIVKPGTTEEVPYGTEGEICLTGPTVMVGYINHEKENADTLRTHEDGNVWLHTGDLGVMDEDGFIYFKQRIKRMIVTSGYNVYPSQIENILDAHAAVQMSCVIGVPDSYKMSKVKAFVTLKEGFAPSQELKEQILAHCRRHVAKYAMPYDIEFRDSLPKTLVGKVAYTQLEKEEAEKRKAAVAKN